MMEGEGMMNQEQVEKLQSFARTFERHFELGFNFEIEKEDVELVNNAAKTLKQQKEELKQLKRDNEGLVIDRECAISNIANGFLDEIKLLREALEFYANNSNYLIEWSDKCDEYMPSVADNDGGEIARQALGGEAHE